jgi:dolichyl-phosphate mannosyltransferase polypeptide 2 regulatory subunit
VLVLCDHLLLQPFIDADHPIQRFFLPYHYAISIPALLLVLLFSGAATFIGLVMIKSQKKKKSD